MEIYKKSKNGGYNQNVFIEHYLVLNYEIWPDQIIFALRVHKFWFTIFRDKWNKQVKLIINEGVQS